MPQILTEGNGGWVRFEDDDLDPAVFVRFEDVDGRLRPVDMFLPGQNGLSANLLRKVPLGSIETWANAEDVASSLRAKMGVPGPDLRRAASYFSTSFSGAALDEKRRPHWVARMFAAQVPGSGEKQPRMGKLAAFDKSSRQRTDELPSAALDRPAARPYGDDFYRQVAEVYRELVTFTRKPAEVIADANQVENVSTVHRWIREARRRGFLPSGQKGRVG